MKITFTACENMFLKLLGYNLGYLQFGWGRELSTVVTVEDARYVLLDYVENDGLKISKDQAAAVEQEIKEGGVAPDMTTLIMAIMGFEFEETCEESRITYQIDPNDGQVLLYLNEDSVGNWIDDAEELMNSVIELVNEYDCDPEEVIGCVKNILNKTELGQQIAAEATGTTTTGVATDSTGDDGTFGTEDAAAFDKELDDSLSDADD